MLRLRVDFDQDAVGTDGFRGAGKGRYIAPDACRVTRIDDNRQVRAFSQDDDRPEVEGVTHRSIEGSDASFTQNNLFVARREDVFSGVQKFIECRRRPSFKNHRTASSANLTQQAVILHVSRADLQDVGIFGHELNVAF